MWWGINFHGPQCVQLCIYTVSQKKCGVKLFAITTSTVTDFENSFTVRNDNKLSIK